MANNRICIYLFPYNKSMHLELFLLLLCSTIQYQIINALNCGSQNILQSPLVRYTSDEMYEGLTSKSIKKDTIPSKYIDPIDMQLLSTERTSDSSAFSYYLRLKGPDTYLLLFKFIEMTHKSKGERVFQIRIGDQWACSIDIAAQVGAEQVLHKWIQFQLRQEVIFINGSLPALNGYIYPKQLMKLTFAAITSQPKIQALILIKGSDSSKFLAEFLQYQRGKYKSIKQYLSDRYHKPIKLPYRYMTGTEIFELREQNIWFYIKKIFSLNTLFSIVAVSFVLLHEKIYEKLNIPKEEKKKD